jgi:hypothetical protein
MVDTREREVVYTTDATDSGPSTAMVILFSLLIVAVLGFMIYYFSNNDLRTNNTIIERNTETTIPVPLPTPSAPPAPSTPDLTPDTTPAPAPSNP